MLVSFSDIRRGTEDNMKITAVIVAGGKGTRMGADKNKLLLKIGDKEILYYTLNAFERNKKIDDMILVAAKNDIKDCERIISGAVTKVKRIVEGGETRRQSVMNGLMAADGDIVLIHDGARALVTDSEINASIEACIRYGAAAAGVKCKDTLKIGRGGFIDGTFHKRAADEDCNAADDCMIAERYGVKVRISEGSYDNIKITTPEDMITAERILERRGEICE